MIIDSRIGIDISLNSTSICIFDGEKYEWINFAPNITKQTRKFDAYLSNKDTKIFSFIKDKRKHKSLSLTETIKVKLNNFNSLYNSLIQSECLDDRESTLINIEGPSYNSRGRAQIDLVVANHYIYFKLIEKGLSNINFISPSEVKKFAGKGNYNKYQMLEAFKNNILNDKFLEKSEFYQWVKNVPIKTKAIPKPIDDLVDAYFLNNFS